MNTILANAGKAFLKAFLAALIVVAPGISQQPNLNGAVAVGIAALMGAVAAGISAVQTYIPEFTVAAYLPAPWGSILDTFIRGFLGAFTVAAVGWLNESNLSTWHAAIVGAITGAITAGLQAIQGTLTLNQKPAMKFGLRPPGMLEPVTPTGKVEVAP